jgi:hypothetical protein
MAKGGESVAPNKFAVKILRKVTVEDKVTTEEVYSMHAASFKYGSTVPTWVDLYKLCMMGEGDKAVADGVYDVVVEAYYNDVLRATITKADYYKCSDEAHTSGVTCGTQATCEACDRAFPVNHTWGDYTLLTEANCGKNATEQATCTACGTATHTRVVADSKVGEHTIEDGVCTVCGFKESYEYKANLDLGATTDYNVYVKLPKDQAQGAYAKITKNGIVVNEKASLQQNGSDYQVTLPGLAAKELCESFTVELYDKNGNAIGQLEESFAQYATRVLNGNNTPEAKKMIADMIHYVAAAQQKWGYKTDDLVTAQVDASLYGEHDTDSDYIYEGISNEKPVDTSGKYYGTSFVLEKSISMNMYVKGLNENSICTYTIKHNDKVLATGTISGTQNKAFYSFNIGKFVTKYGHPDVTVEAKFYVDSTEGAEPVIAVTDSMAWYVERAKAAGEDEAFLNAMMNYVTAVWNCFN